MGHCPEELRKYYEQWASTYNDDVTDEDYCGPKTIVDILVEFVFRSGGAGLDVSDRDIKILDAGCGTGLVGVALAQKGYRRISGCDLSPSMTTIAAKTGVYEDLKADIDLTKHNAAYQDSEYDAVLCCGAFTTGHLPPEALGELMRMVKVGGVLLASVRKSYYEAANFSSQVLRLQRESGASLIYQLQDGPYIAEERATYFALLATGGDVA